MVWMCKQGLASAIVTEDSDVLVYCLACKVDSPVLFKLDDSGNIQVHSATALRSSLSRYSLTHPLQVLSRSIIHENSQATSEITS